MYLFLVIIKKWNKRVIQTEKKKRAWIGRFHVYAPIHSQEQFIQVVSMSSPTTINTRRVVYHGSSPSTRWS